MESRLKSRIGVVVEELARDRQGELAGAGTLLELEKLTGRIGDEVARELCQGELAKRAEQAAAEECPCPECGLLCPRGQPEPLLLQGLRGEVACNQPSYFCRRCRRSFFPSGRGTGDCAAEHRHPRCLAEDGLGGQQSRQL